MKIDLDGAKKVMALIDALEECDDVQNVFTNMDIAPSVQEALDSED